jgi:uncharacterized protein (TIGR02246 family)
MLSDRDQIANVLARYCFYLDDGDVEGFASLFTPHAVLRVRGTVTEGRDAIVGDLKRRGAFGVARHALLTSAIDVATDGWATATSDFLVARRGESGFYSLQTTPGPHFGRYSDRLIYHDDVWRLKERTITNYDGKDAG